MDLNEQNIRQIISSKSKEEALHVIKLSINHKYKTQSDLLRNDIIFELFYDLIEFCLNKGFRIADCARCCSIHFKLIEFIRKTNSSIVTCLELFNEELKELSKYLNDYQLKEYINFMNNTVFTHFRLYKYVFTNERDDETIYDDRSIYRPSSALNEASLKNTKEYSNWQYDHNIETIENQEKQVKQKFMKNREHILEQERVAKNLIEFIKNDAYGSQKPLDEKIIGKLINEIAAPMIDSTQKIIKNDLEEIQELNALTLKKKAIIKPEEFDPMNQRYSENDKQRKKK